MNNGEYSIGDLVTWVPDDQPDIGIVVNTDFLPHTVYVHWSREPDTSGQYPAYPRQLKVIARERELSPLNA